MKRELNVAVVGCGMISKAKHIPAFRRIGRRVRIAAVCDQNEKLATDTAKQFRVPTSYTNLSRLLSKESIDIVDLCVPPQVHGSLAI